MERVIVVDVETTGISAGRGGRVIEIGAVALENGAVSAEFETLIDCGAPIGRSAHRVHGITSDMLVGMPQPADAWNAFRAFIGRDILAAHHALFDRSFVRYELALLGLRLPNPWQCTLRLSRERLPQLADHRLDTVYRHFFGKLPESARRHRALDDARMAARVWVELEKGR